MRNFPEQFIKRVKEMLPADQVDAFLERSTEPLPKTVRLRPDTKIPTDWILKPVAEMPEAFFIDREDPLPIVLAGVRREGVNGTVDPASCVSRSVSGCFVDGIDALAVTLSLALITVPAMRFVPDAPHPLQ